MASDEAVAELKTLLEATPLDASESNDPGLGFRLLAYSCRDCGKSKKTYALLTVLKPVNVEGRESRVAEVMKLGEYPPFGAPIACRIQKLLDKEDLELYRKGSRSEAQGLGIGATTYFRRIVESPLAAPSERAPPCG